MQCAVTRWFLTPVKPETVKNVLLGRLFEMADLIEPVSLWNCSAGAKEFEVSTVLPDTGDPDVAPCCVLLQILSKLDSLLASTIMNYVPVDVKASAMFHVLFSRKLV